MPQLPVDAPAKDEIDLFMLVRALWLQKWIIISVTILVTLAAAVYAYTSKPLYEARIYMLPPTQNGIADFNYGRVLNTDLPPFSVKDVYDVFARNLFSESLRQTFFEEIYLPSLPEESRKGSRDRLYKRFSEKLIISPGGKDNPDRYSIAVQSYSPSEAGDWVRTYVRNASAEAKKEMIKNVVREAQVRARNIDQQITGLREGALKQREDQIQILREALVIAKAIGLQKPVVFNRRTPAELSLGVDGQTLYMRGSDALQAEIQSLESRGSDDPFITNLRMLQVKYSFLNSLTVDASSVSVYRQDGEVDDPDSPIKPDKLSILVRGAFLGLFLGLMMGLLSHFIPLLRVRAY